MSSQPSMRSLYYGLTAGVLSTLLCLGLIAPVSANAQQLASDDTLTIASPEQSTGDVAPPLSEIAALLPQQLERVAITARSVQMNRLPIVRVPRPVELTAVASLDSESGVTVFPITLPETEAFHDGTAEGRGRYALGRVNFDAEPLGFTMSFHSGRLGYLGLTFVAREHIEIYVRPDMSDDELVFVVAHEIGHAVDLVLNDEADRAAWRAERNMDRNGLWWPTESTSDWETPAGDFAECFARWTTGLELAHTDVPCDGTEELLAELATGEPVDRGGNPDAVLASTD